MKVKELINKLKKYNEDLYVVVRTYYYQHDCDVFLSNDTLVTDVYLEEECCVMLSDTKFFRHKAVAISPMVVKEVIDELSKYPPNLVVNTETFDSVELVCYGLTDSLVCDINKVSGDEGNNTVILTEME